VRRIIMPNYTVLPVSVLLGTFRLRRALKSKQKRTGRLLKELYRREEEGGCLEGREGFTTSYGKGGLRANRLQNKRQNR
jgi:hypothetical protein